MAPGTAAASLPPSLRPPARLFSYVDEGALFSKPTFARLLALLDNYQRMTGKEEAVTRVEDQEVNAFLDEIFKTQVMEKLSQFFISKGKVPAGQEMHSCVRTRVVSPN